MARVAGFFATLSLIFIAQGFPQADGVPELDELRSRADQILAQTNTTARGQIRPVFDLIDKLIEGGQSEEAALYLVKALRLEPWNLEYQMTFAEVLTDLGRNAQAEDKARLVLENAESQELRERAAQILHLELESQDESLPNPASDEPLLLLVPLEGADRWLVRRMREELEDALDIPVRIEHIAIPFPPPSRDDRSRYLNRSRKEMLDTLEPERIRLIAETLDFSVEELEDDANFEIFMRKMVVLSNGEEPDDFDYYLDQMEGVRPQWDAIEIQQIFQTHTEPAGRANAGYLAILPVDIYAKDYNFVFGWAGPRWGVMSYRRFTADFNGEIPDRERLLKRTLMQCLSSAGYIFGVPRCTDPTCARAYPNSLAEHDAKKGTLCFDCKQGFRERFRQIKSRINR